MTQDPSFTFSVLIPVMLLIVVEISSIARSISLFDYLAGDAEEIDRGRIQLGVESLFTLTPFFETDSRLLTFGHWGALHSLNSIILLFGVTVVGYSLDGIAEFTLTMAVLIVLTILPYLEVQELNVIKNQGIKTRSARNRAIPMFILGSFASVLGEALAVGIPVFYVIVAGALFVGIPGAIVEGRFGVNLRDELERAKTAMAE